jgi:hypothetical protein
MMGWAYILKIADYGAGPQTQAFTYDEADRLLSAGASGGSSGTSIGELRYKVWGEQRYSSGRTYTNRRFTGQLRESTLGGVEGLYYFNARWVDVYHTW